MRPARAGARVGRQLPFPDYLCRLDVDLGSAALEVGEADPIIWWGWRELRALHIPEVDAILDLIEPVAVERDVELGKAHGAWQAAMVAIRSHSAAIGCCPTRMCRKYLIAEPTAAAARELALSRMAEPPTAFGRIAREAHERLDWVVERAGRYVVLWRGKWQGG